MLRYSLANICWGEPRHAAALVPLLTALHLHDVPDASDPGRALMLAHASQLLDGTNPHRLVIAWDERGAAMGLAAVAIAISVSEPRPERRTQMDLKELFVLPQARGCGVGKALMRWIEDEAIGSGVCRIDWHVRRDNGRGIAFYEALGARIVEGRLSMRKLVADPSQHAVDADRPSNGSD